MQIREITSKEEWEGFLKECKEKTFLHSFAWGEFQELMRERVWRFGFYEGEVLQAMALVIKVAAKRGTFLLVPHGPVCAEVFDPETSDRRATADKPVLKQDILQLLLRHLKLLAKKEKASFIRINPIWERSQENITMFKELGFLNAPIQMHPEASWKLDLADSEEQLFSAMRKTTRYLLRQAMNNKDIVVEQSDSLADVAVFAAMHKMVSLRQSFVPFSSEYLKNEFEVFSKGDGVRLFFAKYKEEIAAVSFVVFWSGIAFYHHAASLPQYAKLSLPYLLQWEAIKEAKKRGCVLYDFWGYVDPKTQPKHPWAGPTLFKQGFGGEAYLYIKGQDYPLSLKYWFTAFFETMRRMRRHL